MTAKSFYRTAATLPFVAMIPGIILNGMPGPLPGEGIDGLDIALTFSNMATLLTVVGFSCAIPYLIYLGGIAAFVRPQTESAFRRVTLLAPIVVVAEFVVGLTALQQITDGPGTLSLGWTVFFPGVVGLFFGYGYVAVIEGSLAVAKRAGWVQPG